MTYACANCRKPISRNHERCNHCCKLGSRNGRFGKPVSDGTRAQLSELGKRSHKPLAPLHRSSCVRGHEGWMYKCLQWNDGTERYYWGWRCRECERLSNRDRSQRRRDRLKQERLAGRLSED